MAGTFKLRQLAECWFNVLPLLIELDTPRTQLKDAYALSPAVRLDPGTPMRLPVSKSSTQGRAHTLVHCPAAEAYRQQRSLKPREPTALFRGSSTADQPAAPAGHLGRGHTAPRLLQQIRPQAPSLNQVLAHRLLPRYVLRTIAQTDQEDPHPASSRPPTVRLPPHRPSSPAPRPLGTQDVPPRVDTDSARR